MHQRQTVRSTQYSVPAVPAVPAVPTVRMESITGVIGQRAEGGGQTDSITPFNYVLTWQLTTDSCSSQHVVTDASSVLCPVSCASCVLRPASCLPCSLSLTARGWSLRN
jgi:hypothetical protein